MRPAAAALRIAAWLQPAAAARCAAARQTCWRLCTPHRAGSSATAAHHQTVHSAAAARTLLPQLPGRRRCMQGGVSNSQRRCSAAADAAGGGQPGGGVQQMSVQELKEVLADEDLRETVQLLDVREPWEAEESSLPHFTLLPLSRQQEWAADIAQQLDPDKHTIVLCHHGMRSNMVANFLASGLDFSNVSNVVGGIDAYATVDPSTPRY